MTTPASPDNAGSSTRPYLIRALHDWCTDNGFTPYIAVHVDGSVRVPMEYVKDNEIVLNVGFEATSGLKLGNEWIEFKARFSGGPREIFVPVDHVVAIYARENGQGMAFPMPVDAGSAPKADAPVAPESPEASPVSKRGGPSAVPGAAAPAPARGLRLASADNATAADVTDHTGATSSDEGHGTQPDTDPPSPATPAPGRPALKRIK